MGTGQRHQRRDRWDRWQGQYPYGYPYGDPYGYGFDPYGGGGGDQQYAALWAQIQMLQQQLQQSQMPMPDAPSGGPPGAPSPGGPPPGGTAPAPGASAQIKGWYDMVGALPPPNGLPWPPRAAVVDAPLPTQANRDILPMSTGVPILPTQSAQITGRPQTLVFKIGRFVISNAGTAGGSADWIVNDIKIGNRSQFVQSGDVPGDLFATNAIDTFVRFESAQTAMDVVVVCTYIGLNESGCPFFGAMVGTAAV
jgi:hypothetical protein